MISKQQYEAQLRQIFKLLLENKTQDEIARELNIGVRTVARYYQRIDKRYGQIQRQKTDNTIYLECQLFKNGMLNLYKVLEKKAEDPKSSGMVVAKCAEIAANIAIDVLKMESEGIKAVVIKKQEEGLAAQQKKKNAAAVALNNNMVSTRDMDMMDDESEESC